MSKNVKVAGTSYTGVPAIILPLATGSGTAKFTDTSASTVTAERIVSGYGAYDSTGTWVNGTSPGEDIVIDEVWSISGDTLFIDDGSGGITPTGTISITQNGTVDVTNYASANVNVPNSYSSSDEGKVVSNGSLVPQGSDTVTQNGTVDTTLISSLLVSVSASGNPIENGTIELSSASTTVSFETSLSSITGILIMPVNTPLTGSRTQAAMICLASGSYYKAISIHTNSGGTGWVSPSVYTSDKFSKSGSTVTVTGAYSFRPAVGYVWYAW